MTTSFGQFSNSQLSSQTFECIDELQVGSRSNLPYQECQILCGSLAKLYTTLSSRHSSNVALLSGNAQLKWRPKNERAGIQIEFATPIFRSQRSSALPRKCSRHLPLSIRRCVASPFVRRSKKRRMGACHPSVSECSIHVLCRSTRHILNTKYLRLGIGLSEPRRAFQSFLGSGSPPAKHEPQWWAQLKQLLDSDISTISISWNFNVIRHLLRFRHSEGQHQATRGTCMSGVEHPIIGKQGGG